jgi:hypothetical protein
VITWRYEATKTQLVATGNSHGEPIRAERCDELTAVSRPREGWAESAAAAAAAGDDRIPGWDFPSEFDTDEWTWDEE